MYMRFAENLKKLRIERGLSQRELADMIYVDRSTVGKWENGKRLPDAVMILRLSRCLGVDTGTLLSIAEDNDGSPNVILVDDSEIILTGGLPVLEAALPNATIAGFTRPSEAVEYARANKVALAFLDIEMGRMSGLELCQKLLEINPRTNIVFLTAYADYSFDAWKTGASGFMLKPLTPEGVREQLQMLRYPFRWEAQTSE